VACGVSGQKVNTDPSLQTNTSGIWLVIAILQALLAASSLLRL
jgi:hypothetical protein